MLIFFSFFNLFLSSGAMAIAPNNCPQIQEALKEACKNSSDLCYVRDELIFSKLVKLAERAHVANHAQYEKYQALLKGPPARVTLKDIASLQEEVSPCVMQTQALWSVLLNRESLKSPRKTAVQDLIQKKLLNPDLYSFTSESLKSRISLIQEAIAFNLLILNENQSLKWNEFIQSLRQEKKMTADTSKSQNYSEKARPAPVQGESKPADELASLNEIFVKIRLSHQKINEIFQ